jgi:hypothetical protein
VSDNRNLSDADQYTEADMGTILDRGVRANQPVFLDLVRPDETRQQGKDARVIGADFEKETVTVVLTVPAHWVRENPNV